MAGYLPPGCTQRECDEAQPGYWDDEPFEEVADCETGEAAEPTEKCVACGRFIAFSEMEEGGGASFYFEPDNHFGPERSEWTCKRCASKGES